MKKLIRFWVVLIGLFLLENINAQCNNLNVSAGSWGALNTEVLYLEDFSGQDDKGAIFNTIDVSGCDWTIDVTAATLSNTNDWFKVKNEKLEARDVDGNCIWYSPTIDISGYSNISLSLIASENSGLENSDIFYSEYRIDGGVWTYFTNFGQLINDFGTRTVSQSGLVGSNVEIRVTINVDQNNEYLKLDDIQVTGQIYKDILCYGTSMSIGGSPTADWSGAGSPAITYSWTPTNGLSDPTIANPVANPTTTSTYIVIASLDDNGTTCMDSSRIVIDVTPQVSIVSSDPVCVDDTLSISENAGDASAWTWSSNGTANIISFEDSTTQVVGMVDGEVFTVDIEDNNGCVIPHQQQSL